jgi:hypothetical protein
MEFTMTGTADRSPIAKDEIVEFCTGKLYALMGELSAALAYAKQQGVNQEVISARLEKDKAQISRVFNVPKNVTVWTACEAALAMDCDVEFKITPFALKPIVNFKHEVPPDNIQPGTVSRTNVKKTEFPSNQSTATTSSTGLIVELADAR